MDADAINNIRLPKAIDCKNLVETLVEVRFNPNPQIVRELWAGLIVSRLEKFGYIYIPVPQINTVKEKEDSVKITIEKETANSSVSLFFNEKTNVRFMLKGSELTFNCAKGNYLGWNSYLEEIIEILRVLETEKIALSFSRTKLRYISEYDIDILQHVEIKVDAHSDNRYRTLEINLAREEETSIAYIAISGLRERVGRSSQERKMASLFDVSVLDRLTDNSTVNDVVNSLNRIHKIEKESFFGMLTPEFIESLNPIYE